MEPSFDATVFTKNRRRLLRHRVGRTLFEEVAGEADHRGKVDVMNASEILALAVTAKREEEKLDPDTYIFCSKQDVSLRRRCSDL